MILENRNHSRSTTAAMERTCLKARVMARRRVIYMKLKEMLAAEDELKGFAGHATKTAALEYIISVESDVFVPSHSGNMAKAVEGHRRFPGHHRTITPDRKGLVKLLNKVEIGQLQGVKLSNLVKQLHQARQGAPRRRKGPTQGIKGHARFKSEEVFYEIHTQSVFAVLRNTKNPN